MEVVGERWTLLVVRDALQGKKRFEEFQASLGIARNVLAKRLDTLVEHGVMERVPYSERPLRHEYRLTEAGRELRVPLIALLRWGERNVHDPEAPHVASATATAAATSWRSSSARSAASRPRRARSRSSAARTPGRALA